MIKGTSHEWELTDAEVQIEDDRFWNCVVEVEIEKYYRFLSMNDEVHGSILFTHPVPDSVFFGDDKIPKALNIVAKVDEHRLEIESALVTSRDSDSNEFEFVARDADMVIQEEEPEQTIENRTIELLDNLAVQIVDGDATVSSVSVGSDPVWTNDHWEPGDITLEVVYRE